MSDKQDTVLKFNVDKYSAGKWHEGHIFGHTLYENLLACFHDLGMEVDIIVEGIFNGGPGELSGYVQDILNHIVLFRVTRAPALAFKEGQVLTFDSRRILSVLLNPEMLSVLEEEGVIFQSPIPSRTQEA